MDNYYLYALVGLIIGISACKDDALITTIDEPAFYTFDRNGKSTVSFEGQTTRILMAEELIYNMKNFTATEDLLLEMFRNETASGGDANPFSDTVLNSSTKSIKSKTAASVDFFSSNQVEAAAIKNTFETWIKAQVNEVFPNENALAEAGKPGQLADGNTTRYISENGIEYNQLVAKGLIGALMLDQIVNNYLSTTVLDEGDNRTANSNGTVEEGTSFTTMEHKWDEAYGYVYGKSADASNPNATLGDDDNFLNEYVASVDSDTDFNGIAEEIFNAFKRGRAAIVAGDYLVRDEQAFIIKQKLSEVIAIRGIYYLQQGKILLEQSPPAYGSAFHNLSEGLGFVYSLRFLKNYKSEGPFFNQNETAVLFEKILQGQNGLWDVTPEILDEVSESMGAPFIFSVEQAGSNN